MGGCGGCPWLPGDADDQKVFGSSSNVWSTEPKQPPLSDTGPLSVFTPSIYSLGRKNLYVLLHLKSCRDWSVKTSRHSNEVVEKFPLICFELSTHSLITLCNVMQFLVIRSLVMHWLPTGQCPVSGDWRHHMEPIGFSEVGRWWIKHRMANQMFDLIRKSLIVLSLSFTYKTDPTRFWFKADMDRLLIWELEQIALSAAGGIYSLLGKNSTR